MKVKIAGVNFMMQKYSGKNKKDMISVNSNTDFNHIPVSFFKMNEAKILVRMVVVSRMVIELRGMKTAVKTGERLP